MSTGLRVRSEQFTADSAGESINHEWKQPSGAHLPHVRPQPRLCTAAAATTAALIAAEGIGGGGGVVPEDEDFSKAPECARNTD